MSKEVEIRVPDIGDFTDIPVVEVLVKEGQSVAAEQSLVTLESDKAVMEIPAPSAGTVASLGVVEGDLVSEGALVAVLHIDAATSGDEAATGEEASPGEPDPAPAETAEEPASTVEEMPIVEDNIDPADYEYDVLVLGAGPGGYTAAFRAADLGLRVALIERYPALGGVCLNVGCIPSKALLHAAAVIDEAAAMSDHGVVFERPEIDLDKLRGWKDKVVGQLTGGLASMSKKRHVTVIQGTGTFSGDHELTVETTEGSQVVSFARAIIAAGSQPFKLPGLPWDDDRVMDSTDALELRDVPKRLLVIGGGIIGLEMAGVYQGLGSEVTVVELTPQLMPGTDKDLVRPLQKRIKERYAGIHVNTSVTAVEARDDGLHVTFEGSKVPENTVYDCLLVSTGRTPNGKKIGAENAGVEVTERGFIPVDRQMRTNVPHIFAIGDIVGQPMLAHKAAHEAKVAAEVCAGMKSAFEARVIPSVAYTDPEIAWAGLTEAEAKEQGIDYKLGRFPWAASGRALGIGRTEGFTKLLFDPESHRVLGAGIVGSHAGDLIAECVLAIEMGCEAGDIGLSIHPHPTLSETIAMSAEVFEGTVTDLYVPPRK
ncbi:MAG: dihydrolipoyl dehydrogenase [Xanthomonadales bacterium]|nr:dihydrolipoyl dehydrogenase [Xanthomonadales bacterium]